MAWYNPTTWRRKQPVSKEITTDTENRSYDVPTKVFVDRDGPHFEYSIDEPPLLGGFRDLLNGFYGQTNLVELFHCLPEIFAPINEIASRVADATWLLKRASTDQAIYTDPDFNRLFSAPNPLLSIQEHVYQAVCYELLTGKNYFFFNRPSTLDPSYKNILTWSNLPSQKVRANLFKGVDPWTITELADLIRNYELPYNGKKRIFETEQILPIVKFDPEKPTDPNCGKAPILGAEKPIKNLIPVYEARGTIYIKRGVMGFIVSRKSDASGMVALSPTEKEEAAKEVNGRYGLTGGKSTISVTAAPVDFVKTAMSIKEMEPFDETLADAVAIYAVLRVPRHLVPSKDTSTFANAASDMKNFYNDVIIPMANRYAQAWTNYMGLSELGKYICPDFSHIHILQDNRKEKAEVDRTNGEVWEKRLLCGIASLNDWIRATDGQPVTDNPIYDKKIFELSPEELEIFKNVINLSRNGSASNTKGSTEDPGSSNPAK